MLEWFHDVGEEVTAGEPLVALEGEKVDGEVEVPVTGRFIEIVAASGTEVVQDQVLARIDA